MSHWTAINPVGQSPSPAPIKRVREAGRAPSTPDGDASPPPSPRKKRSKRSLMETEEALEARLTASYEKTLRSHDKPAVATGMYVEILQFIASLDDMGALSTTTRKIQYLCLKNLARLEAKSDPNATERALQHYADALDIDTTDCLVWYEAGCVAFQLQQFGLARAYLEEAFALDACFWPMVYKLVLVLYVLQDEAECLRVVKHVLAHDPKHPVATYLDGKLSGQCSAIMPCPASVVAAEAQRAHTHTQLPATRHSNVLAYTLQDNSWASLGALLLELFDEAHASVDDASLSMHQSIVILPSPAAAPVEVAPPVKTEVAANTSMVITAPSVPEIINISDDDDDDDDDVVIVEAIPVPDTDAATAKPLNAVVASLRKSSDTDPASPATQSRRTSHRTQKRMQDEIEAAIKEAKEKDIAYQLLSFIDKDADAAVPHDTSIYDTCVRAEMAPDGSALRFFRGANEEATLELAPAVAKELLSSPLSSPLPDEDALTSLVLSVEGFLGSLSGTKGHSLEALMVEFLEAVAQHPGVALGNDLLRIVRLMDCSLHDAPDARPVLASPDLHLSLSCRLFLLELHVDALIAGYDPLMHSRVEFFAALQHQQQHLLRWKLDFCETASDALDATLDLRFRWLQIHLNEHLGHVDAVLNALQALQTLLGSSVLALGNVATFPRLSRSAVERKLQKQALTVLAKQVCDRFATVDPSTTMVETEIVDLVLPHYDPRAGKGSRVEDLVLQFRLYLLQMYDWKKATSPLAKPAPPLLTMLIKCLVRLERDDVCYELLCLSWYYSLQHQAATTDKTTVQCLKYVTSQLQTVFAKKPYITPAYMLLHHVCAFQCRDFMLRHFHSSSLLNILAQTLPSAHVPSLVGKILHQLTSIDLRKRGNTSLLALSLSALQLLYQHLKTMDASTTIPPALAKALSSSIAVYLKTQIEAGKFRAQSRQLLYASCTSFLLLWQYLDDGNTLQDGIQMTELLHDLLTSGDGLEDHGMCGLDGDRTFLLTTRQILTKIQEKADKSDESLIEDLEEALAQCYCCLYGYALLPSCVEHLPKEGKKPTPRSADDMFALLSFAQSLDPKHCTRKECYLLYKDVLALPETAEMMKTSLFDNNAIGGYVNPVASADVHVKLPPIAAAKNAPTPDATPVNDLWFLLATTMPFPKCKRRGKDYSVLLEYEQYCLQYMQYLRRDVRVHPLRAEAYELLAQSARTLRALVVDHMNVVWSNHFVLQALPLQRTILLEAGVQPTFDEVSATPFFQNVLQWTDAVDKTLPDDVASLTPKSRLFLRQYTQYTAALTELALRSMDMAAELDPAAYRVECGEDSGFLLYARLSERQLANTEAVRVAEAAGRYFKNALADASCSPVTTLRVHYMLGKLGKKILTLHNELHLSSSWRSVLESFANADKARVDDDADEYLVHAFHLLHATRLKLLLAPVLQRCTPATVPELRHAPLPRLDDALPSAEMLALIEAFAYKKDDATPVVLETDPRKRFQAALENCVSALEVVPQEDKYFHPAYFSLARGVFYAGAIVEDETKYGAAAALKAMKPLFDKKRSQIVSVWLSESDTHKLDELHQTQAAYDKLRLKYHQFYMHLLTAGGDNARICEITNWITSSKEEHWVLDAMLAQALVARSYLARGRVLDMYMKCLFPQSDDEPASAKAVAHLHRMYGVYMESQDAWQRARPYNHGSSMGSWLWEVTMAYALAQASLIESGADLLGVVAVAHVKTHLDTRDPLTTNETSLLGLHLELKMEDRRDWADLVDNALAYCATTWPEKTKSNKSKLPTPKTKPHLTLA